MKKILATAAIAASLLLAAPVAANAVDPYQGSTTPTTGAPGSANTYSVVTGEANTVFNVTISGNATFVTAATAAYTSDASGVVTFRVSFPTAGTYTISATSTVTGVTYNLPAVTISGAALPVTGTTDLAPFAWFGGGALLLGAGLITVATITRKRQSVEVAA